MVRFLTAFLFTFTCIASYALDNVTATVDRNPVFKGESFILEVVADDEVDSDALDTSALLTDFIVGRTSVSSQTSMINFKTSRSTRWSTVLIAKRTGEFVIPALKIEDKYTQPITIKVHSPQDSSASNNRDLFITNEISNTELYVQQNITLTVKLHFAANLKRGSLSEPQLENAIIKQIGQDQESDAIINGRRFRVIERTYTISPQESGNFTLKSPLFSGEIQLQTSGGRSSFFSFGETKSVSVIGEDINLAVKPIPEGVYGAWLPAELLTVHDEWQPDPQAFVVGEPITRTITITAAGLSQEQLPIIELAEIADLKLYPDQANLHTSLKQSRLVSQKVQSFAVVASKPGEYTIPAFEIPWWNTVTNRQEVAKIASQTITVKPNPNASASLPAAPAITDNTQLTQPMPAPAVETQIVTVEKTPWLQWLFLGLWLLTMALWALTTYLGKRKNKVENSQASTVNEYYLQLLSACKQGDGAKVQTLLVPWLNLKITHEGYQHATISNTAQACELINDDRFTKAFNELQESYYSKTQKPWNGKALFGAIQQVQKTKLGVNAKSKISLNP
ncbi:protein BatD [Thalassotalea sp. LPB0316]|uniref:BatD family protein n=1 Tax=Thalassotalea sp. LPB0316 TaxID=2769490 RepID=UPI001868D54E|nr:BatD family protein [Thalassotalea sp. LPB0316]QOL24438.1 protein BatD [Thalassotalea sp. LPB0316]